MTGEGTNMGAISPHSINEQTNWVCSLPADAAVSRKRGRMLSDRKVTLICLHEYNTFNISRPYTVRRVVHITVPCPDGPHALPFTTRAYQLVTTEVSLVSCELRIIWRRVLLD